ncbi:hypothetical protein NXW13_13835 [Bacteroides thetaiotaomicron]|nr:hypothetical protein [Bacteroides thetaiotaomicron]
MDARELVYTAKQLVVYETKSMGTTFVPSFRTNSTDVNTLQERYFRELKEDCAINSASDAYYVSAIACFCLTFIFPPAVIGAAICVYRAKQLKKEVRNDIHL